MVTGRDVAQRAGTSTAVVSYVFNNGPRNVAPATRDRVLQAAAELGYQPNALARALSFGRTSSIGLIVPDIANRYFGELARALETAAAARGNVLLIGDSRLDAERERSHVAAFVERRVDSLVLVSVQDELDISPLTQAEVPVVALHPVASDVAASTISIDYEQAAAEATTHLRTHGYTSIALLNGPGDSPGALQHRAGFLTALDATGGDVVQWRELHSRIDRSDAAGVALDVLSRPDRPRAVYCTTDEQAHGVLFACHRLGLSVPDDVAVTGFDGTEHSAYSIPPLTTVRQPIVAMAERAIALLAAADRTEASVPVHEIATHELVLRESCGTH